MKLRFIIAFIFFFGVLIKKNFAQSGWQENNYYTERGTSDIIYGICYSVFVGYDYYGRPVYKWYQNCQRRDWHSWYGTRSGYFWNCNGSTCFWDVRYEERSWWYFTFYSFNPRMLLINSYSITSPYSSFHSHLHLLWLHNHRSGYCRIFSSR